MESSWRRRVGNVRLFIGNSMGGLRGTSNMASRIVAGTLAYFLWERATLAASNPYRYVEKRKPVPDPQETGLIYDNKKKSDTKTEE